ncbi:MAG: glycoside hydrolase family 88 protein [Cyclobacteriaceae bacterium]
MKKLLIAVIAITVYGISCSNPKSEKTEEKAPVPKPMKEVVDGALSFSVKQTLRMADKLVVRDSVLPRTFMKNEMITSDSRWWTSGFFPGVLWYLYEYSNDEKLLNHAREFTARVEREKFTTDNHDVGFMLYCSFGNGLRITGEKSYEEVLLTGAKSLSTRYKPNLGVIRSWDSNREKWQYPVIIDNMMNLELMFWASKYSGDSFFSDLSISHADKTIEHHYRPDFSCVHVVSYDTISGLPHVKNTHQGYSDDSSWSRGQSWGLYGYVLMYRETGDAKYLEHAKNIASFLINHPNMPEDYIPYWDYNAPNIPNELRDSSAGALIASALLELHGMVDDQKLKERYVEVVETQLRALASPSYRAELGENGDFILMHGVGSMPHESEIDVPLTYGDYYFIEALLRYKKLMNI